MLRRILTNSKPSTRFFSSYRIPETKRMWSQQLQKLGSKDTRIQAALLDWSGTTADMHVIAPAVVFRDVFAEFAVPITMEQARAPMGLRKDLHIKTISEMPDVREKWLKIHNRYPNQEDVDAMFKLFVPMQLACLPTYSTLIPGTLDAASQLRKMKVRLGLTTGFTRIMSDVLLTETKKQGFHLDCDVAGDDTAMTNGVRPAPHMLYRNMDKLNISDPRSVVKVGDTIGDIGEGLHAGCWTVALFKYSNYTNINSLEECKNMLPAERIKREQLSRLTLLKSGAHYVTSSIAELPGIVHDINLRLGKGEMPTFFKRPQEMMKETVPEPKARPFFSLLRR